MLDTIEIVESSNTCEQGQLFPAEGGDSCDQFLRRPERAAFFARIADSLGRLFAQPFQLAIRHGGFSALSII